MSLLHHPAWKHLRWLPWLGAAGLLLLPLLAMQFTDEVQWTGIDFLVMGALLLAVCTGFELALRAAHNSTYMLAAAIGVGSGFLLAWVNLAVGVIGNEDHPANLVFFGVLAVGLLGTALARLRPHGMALAMLATAIAQTLATVLTAMLGDGYVFVLAGIFAGLWLLSAWLFRLSATQPASPAP